MFVITTIAGSDTNGYRGDDGPATSAGLYYPFGVVLDSAGTHYTLRYSKISVGNNIHFINAGNVYIADSGNLRIRKVTVSTGIITTIAGTGAASYSGDGGPATSATFYTPEGIALDPAGNLHHYF